MDTQTQPQPWYVSSTNPDNLSMTLRGLLVAIAPLLMAYFKVSQASTDALISGIVGFVQAAVTLIAAAMVLWGLVRKGLVRIGVYK